jgi:hypothetical protein
MLRARPQVCREWEAAAGAVPEDVRCCVLRIGIVLAKDGGALGKMMPIFQLFAGGCAAAPSAALQLPCHCLPTCRARALSQESGPGRADGMRA